MPRFEKAAEVGQLEAGWRYLHGDSGRMFGQAVRVTPKSWWGTRHAGEVLPFVLLKWGHLFSAIVLW